MDFKKISVHSSPSISKPNLIQSAFSNQQWQTDCLRFTETALDKVFTYLLYTLLDGDQLETTKSVEKFADSIRQFPVLQFPVRIQVRHFPVQRLYGDLRIT